MLEGLATLLSLSTLMAIASFGAGLLPLTLSLSQSRLRFISTLGMGVLVGTALIVIIPEGIQTLYSSTDGVDHIHRRSPELMTARGVDVTALPIAIAVRRRDDLHYPVEGQSDTDRLAGLGSSSASQDPPRTPIEPGVVGILETGSTTSTPPESSVTSREPHAWIGVSLVSGFILMYLIDTLPSLNPPKPVQRSNIYSLTDLSSNIPPSATRQRSSASFSTTLGLVIHAAADGIALGASSTISSVTFVIFFAIMIHKAPAAFGLTSVLLKQGMGKRQARVHLLAFSLAAPAGALLTWFIVRILGGNAQSAHPESMKFWTGVILIFSGGTFLYVAMHTMQDIDLHATSEEPQGNGYLDPPDRLDRPRPGKNLQLIGVSVIGMLLPLITQIGHAH